ncbi:MAG: hypothetical protein ACEQSX_18795, partial [Baekduiaceae bacterium]
MRAILFALVALLVAAAPAAAEQPWRAAEQARQDLFAAQTSLDTGDQAGARADVARAARRLRTGLAAARA